MGIKEQTVSARTYADLIGIVALRIIEIGDQSARFGFLPLSLFLCFLSFFLLFPAYRRLAYREQEVITRTCSPITPRYAQSCGESRRKKSENRSTTREG